MKIKKSKEQIEQEMQAIIESGWKQADKLNKVHMKTNELLKENKEKLVKLRKEYDKGANNQ